jgi:hypothetical protein
MTKTKIVFNKDWNEYVVGVWIDGKRHEAADYFTNDKEDAVVIAALMENN